MNQAIDELVQLGIFFSENSDELHAWRNLEPDNKVEWLEMNGYNPKLITILEQQDHEGAIEQDLLLHLRQLLIANTINSILEATYSQLVDDYIRQYAEAGGSQTGTQKNSRFGSINQRLQHANQLATQNAKELREVANDLDIMKQKAPVEHVFSILPNNLTAVKATRELGNAYRMLSSKSDRSIATKEINAIATRQIRVIFAERQKEFRESSLGFIHKTIQHDVIDNRQFELWRHGVIREVGFTKHKSDIVYGGNLVHNGPGSGSTLQLGYTKGENPGDEGSLNLTYQDGHISVSLRAVSTDGKDTRYIALEYSGGSGIFGVGKNNNYQTQSFTDKAAVQQLSLTHQNIVKAHRSKDLNRARDQLIQTKYVKFLMHTIRIIENRDQEIRSGIASTRKKLERLEQYHRFIDKQIGSVKTVYSLYTTGRKQAKVFLQEERSFRQTILNIQKTGKYEGKRIEAPTKKSFKEQYSMNMNYGVKLDERLLKSGGIKLDYQLFEDQESHTRYTEVHNLQSWNIQYYNTQKYAYKASRSTYQNAIASGHTTRQARNLATLRYFDVLAQEDIHYLAYDFIHMNNKSNIRLAMSAQRQRRVAERVIFLDRHPFAWHLRLSFDMWRATLINNQLSTLSQNMAKKDSGIWHRTRNIARHDADRQFRWMKKAGGKALKPDVWLANRVSSLWGGHLGTKMKHIDSGLFNLTEHITHLLAHSLIRLPLRLYKDTKILGRQIITALRNPMHFKAHLDALGRDTKGIRHILKNVVVIGEYVSSELRWMLSHPKQLISRNQIWSHGFCHKHVHKELKMVEFVASVMGIMPYRKELTMAVKIDVMKHSLKKAIHRQTDLLHPSKKARELLLADPFVSNLYNKIGVWRDGNKITTRQKLNLLKKFHKFKASTDKKSSPLYTKWSSHKSYIISTSKHKSMAWVNKNINSKVLKKWTRKQLLIDYKQANDLIRLHRYAQANEKKARLAERDSYFIYRYHPYSLPKDIMMYKKSLKMDIKTDWNKGGGKLEFQGFNKYISNSLVDNKKLFNKYSTMKKHDIGYETFSDIVLAYAIAKVFQDDKLRQWPSLASSFVETLVTSKKSTMIALDDYRKYLIYTDKMQKGSLSKVSLATKMTTFVLALKKCQAHVRKKYHNISRLRRIGSLQIDSKDTSFILKQWKDETLLNPIAQMYAQIYSPNQNQVDAYSKWVTYNRTEGSKKDPQRLLRNAFQNASTNPKAHLYYTTNQLITEYHAWNGEPITIGQIVKTLFKPTSSWVPLPAPRIPKHSYDSHSNSSSANINADTGRSVQLLQYYAQLKFVKHLFFRKKKVAKKAKSLDGDSAKASSKEKNILEDNTNSIDKLSSDGGIVEKDGVDQLDALMDQEFKDIMLQSLDSIVEHSVDDISSDLTREITQVDESIDVEIETDEAVADDLVEVALL